jgi:hypothetical protein
MVSINIVNVVDSNKTIVETCEKFFSVGVPCQSGTHEISGFFSFFFGGLSFNGGNWFGRSAHQIPNFNRVFSSDSDPLHFWVESDLIDGGTSIKFSGVVGKIEDIPDIKFFVFTSGSDIFSVGGDRYGIDISFMGFEGISDLEVGAPDF